MNEDVLKELQAIRSILEEHLPKQTLLLRKIEYYLDNDPKKKISIPRPARTDWNKIFAEYSLYLKAL